MTLTNGGLFRTNNFTSSAFIVLLFACLKHVRSINWFHKRNEFYVSSCTNYVEYAKILL